MVCSKCGFDNSNNAKFCEQCGEALESRRDAAEEQKDNNRYYDDHALSRMSNLSSDAPEVTEIPTSAKETESKKSINPLIMIIPAGIFFVIIASTIVFTAFKFVSKHFLHNNTFLNEEKYAVEEITDEIEDGLYGNDSLPDINPDTIQGTTDLLDASVPQIESEAFVGNTNNITYNNSDNNDANIQIPVDEQQTVNDRSYVLPDSDKRYLSETELQELSVQELRIARNEIYARHGRIFDSIELAEYFNSKSWYTPNIPADQFNEAVFNTYEKANLEIIKQVETLKAQN